MSNLARLIFRLFAEVGKPFATTNRDQRPIRWPRCEIDWQYELFTSLHLLKVYAPCFSFAWQRNIRASRFLPPWRVRNSWT